MDLVSGSMVQLSGRCNTLRKVGFELSYIHLLVNIWNGDSDHGPSQRYLPIFPHLISYIVGRVFRAFRQRGEVIQNPGAL